MTHAMTLFELETTLPRDLARGAAMQRQHPIHTFLFGLCVPRQSDVPVHVFSWLFTACSFAMQQHHPSHNLFFGSCALLHIYSWYACTCCRRTSGFMEECRHAAAALSSHISFWHVRACVLGLQCLCDHRFYYLLRARAPSLVRRKQCLQELQHDDASNEQIVPTHPDRLRTPHSDSLGYSLAAQQPVLLVVVVLYLRTVR